MTTVDRTDATDEEFRARFDRFGIFDEERIVEEVARAIHDADEVGNYPKTWPWEDDAEENRADYRRLAVAAITAYRATDGDLRTRMADVADNLDYYAGKTDGGTYAGGLADAAGQIRAALGGAQDGGAEEAVRQETVVMCTHDGQPEHPWRPGEGCPDALTTGTWSVR